MRRVAGLHAEITLTTALLVAAALLFGGFLLLRLTEQELLDQRVRGVNESVQVLAGALALPGNRLPEKLPALFAPFASDLVAWRFYDGQSNLAIASPRELPTSLEATLLIQQARILSGPQLIVDWPQTWFPFVHSDPGSISAAVALPSTGGDSGVIWVRFSLAQLQDQLFRAHRLLLLYVFLYGSVLTVFGVVALRRNVVRPVQRLQRVVSQVAAGDLEVTAEEAGPREIADLAASFNGMTRALRGGREELLRSERLASVGHLSAGMAHEIGNPLAAIIGYLEVLKSELPAGRQQQIVAHSLYETSRIDRLVRDLLDYAAPDDGASQPIDPAPVVRDVIALLGHQTAFSEFPLVLDSPESLPLVRINPHKLQQILINLIGNARDASASGQSVVTTALVADGRVLLRISDAGAGMPAAARVHIFDPFYTSKAPGQGRGLGLTVCHRIVTEAGGRIDVESNPGTGSTFTVSFPVASDKQD